jgi:YfiR/HmsC-like
MAPGGGPMPGLARHVVMALAVAISLASSAPVAAASGVEYPVKAEFIERFTRFIDWPSDAFLGSDAPFIICVVGDTPIAPHLDHVARVRRIKDRRVEVRRSTAASDLRGCHVAFIASGERPRLKQILAAVSGRPVLTVGDADGFAREGVLINLVLDEESHVRFEICSSEARKSGLKISAQLLRLARLVAQGGP